MSPRYLLAVGDARPHQADRRERLSARTGLQPALLNGRTALFTSPACPWTAVGDAGCIVGRLFRRHGPARALASLEPADAAAIDASDGAALLDRFWGGYVAAISGPETVRILRDPSGTFPCYHGHAEGQALFASDADLLVAAGVPVELDFEEVGRQLYRAFVPSPATALRNVRELLAGFALRVGPGAGNPQSCWSPWDHVADAGEDPGEAADRLSRTLRHCVHSWATTCDTLLLSVSGGLDSSMVAACLAQAGTRTVCLTVYSDDPAGDERPFARTLCDRLALPLIERAYRLEDIDITEPLAAHLPRPRDRTQANAFERVHLEVAAEVGADAFMTGNGGDNVLGYSQSAAAIADRYLAHGFGQGLWQTVADVCRQTGCSLPDAVGRAWRLAHGPPAHKVQPSPLFLDRGFASGLGPADLRHPWLDAPAGALPGKALHISSILRVQPNLEASRGACHPMLSPLVSQPVVEASLAIPSWAWREGGRDRAVARRAFAADLPPLILDRRVKGTPSRFAARLLDHYRKAIRDRLLGGRLAAHRIIDAAALEQWLEGERPVPDLERVRILELVNAEAWLDHWAARERWHRPQPSTGPIP